MKKIDTIVVAPHFYTMEGAGVGYHGDAAMAVDGGQYILSIVVTAVILVVVLFALTQLTKLRYPEKVH